MDDLKWEGNRLYYGWNEFTNSPHYIEFRPTEGFKSIYKPNDTIFNAYILGTSIFITMNSGDSFEFENYQDMDKARVIKRDEEWHRKDLERLRNEKINNIYKEE